ncbi:MAG: hypothetical protein WAN46_11520 [Gammaproteobacteria bacterium]
MRQVTKAISPRKVISGHKFNAELPQQLLSVYSTSNHRASIAPKADKRVSSHSIDEDGAVAIHSTGFEPHRSPTLEPGDLAEKSSPASANLARDRKASWFDSRPLFGCGLSLPGTKLAAAPRKRLGYTGSRGRSNNGLLSPLSTAYWHAETYRKL